MSRRIIPNYTAEHRDLTSQLQSFAEDLMKQARAHLDDPKVYKPAIETIALIGDKLKAWGDQIPLDPKPKDEKVDLTGFE